MLNDSSEVLSFDIYLQTHQRLTKCIHKLYYAELDEGTPFVSLSYGFAFYSLLLVIKDLLNQQGSKYFLEELLAMFLISRTHNLETSSGSQNKKACLSSQNNQTILSDKVQRMYSNIDVVPMW